MFSLILFYVKVFSFRRTIISKIKIIKIMSTVPFERGCHLFTGLGSNSRETATSLETFAAKLETISALSLSFHLQRKDFQNWLRTTVGDDVLAERISHISLQLLVEKLRNDLVETVQDHISHLKLLYGEFIPSQGEPKPIP